MNLNSSLSSYCGKPAVRNFRGRGGDTSVSSAYSRTLNGQCVSSLVHVVRLFSTRRFNLSLLGNSSGYSSYGDREGLHFGIDNGISGSWLDHSRPWKTNPVITTLTVYKGELYAAIGDASRAEDACHVFRFAGGEKWIDCGRVGNNPLTLSVFSTVVHKGKFYAGTGTWDGRNRMQVGADETAFTATKGKPNGVIAGLLETASVLCPLPPLRVPCMQPTTIRSVIVTTGMGLGPFADNWIKPTN